MKCSLGISNFLEGIFSLSLSIVFLYFFALIIEEGFLISPCYSLELYIPTGIYFLLSFAFHFSVSCIGEENSSVPTPVLLPGESQGWGSLVAAVSGVTQSDMTEAT